MMKKEPVVKTVQVGSLEFKYFQCGEGEKELVILRGLSMMDVCDLPGAGLAGYKLLLPYYRITFLDYPLLPKGADTLDDMAESVYQAIRAMGLEHFDLMGCSFGGVLAQCIAAARPESVSRLVLAGTMASVPESTSALFTRWKDFSDRGDSAGLIESFIENVYTPEFVANHAAAFKALRKTAVTEDVFARFSQECGMLIDLDIRNRAGIYYGQTMVAFSMADRVVPHEISLELMNLVSKIRGCSITMYTGSGHAFFDEEPEFKEDLLEFLITDHNLTDDDDDFDDFDDDED